MVCFFWWCWATKAVTSEFENQDSGLKNEEFFVIKKGESLNSIAERLKKEKLIRSSLAFKIVVYTQGLAGKIQAGSFQVSSNWTPYKIAERLTHGTVDVWITFPEGWRREEIVRRLAANIEGFNIEEFLLLTKDLEGYLFPDTYLISKLSTPSAIVKTLTNNFREKTKNLNPGYRELILASIIEREVKYEQDRPIVAGILAKRLEVGWPLQVDATIQYALADSRFMVSNSDFYNYNWWPEITKNDLKIDSPYNTYKYKGLPPTPICNPGLAAIESVLNHPTTNYWFYLSDNKGKIHFAETLEEHQKNINKYLK